MKLLLVVLLMIGQVYGKDCDLRQLGISSPVPDIPRHLNTEPGWPEAYHDVFRVLCTNLRKPDYFFRGYRAHPGPPYKGAYLWDTAFISQVWLNWDPAIAEELIHYVLRFQGKSGIIHHAVAEIILKPLPYSHSQPPLLSWASWRIFEKTQSKHFLRRVYPKLKRYHSWLLKERRHPDGLFFWKTPYESGIDNSPRFANRDESWFDDTTKLASVDMNSYLALDMEALAKMAMTLGNKEEARELRQEYMKLKTLMNEKLWNSKHQMYFDWDYRKNAHIEIHTVSDLTPLIAGIPDKGRARLMMNKIMDKNFYNTKIPFPSVARQESVFIKDMWRGPVWINMAYLSVLGVERYGYHKEATTLAKKLVAGIYGTWMNESFFFEFYDPDRYDITELNRKKGNLWKRLTLGSKPVKNFVGWSGLANNLVMEFGPGF